MKSCPNCGELVGDSVEICFNCNYNFDLHTVMKNSTIDSKDEESRLALNPQYEYEVVVIPDRSSGEVDTDQLRRTLSSYASVHWRLHSVFTNECGKNAMSAAVSGIGFGTNATIDQTVLIFERCVRAEG